MIKRRKIDIPLYKVVGNGGISNTSVGEGRFIPAIIIDTEDSIEVSDLLKSHKGNLPGDTKLDWGGPISLCSPKIIYLTLEFSKPMKISFGIEFLLSEQYSTIDGIIQSRALYLITGKPGDQVSDIINDGILIEVPDMKFDEKWNEILLETITKQYKKQGASKKEAKTFTKDHIKSMRDIWNVRR